MKSINWIIGLIMYSLYKVSGTVKKRYFIFRGNKYEYFTAMYNTTFQNERAVEVPIILKYIQENKDKRILEIGNVLNHYFDFRHDILDKYEKSKGVLNYDILDFKPSSKYDLIISISTFEHIGFDEYSRYSSGDLQVYQNHVLIDAIEKTKDILEDDGLFIFTVPLGYNSFLDSQIRNDNLGLKEMMFLKKTSIRNNWEQVNYLEVTEIEYGRPYKCANALMIGVFKK